MQHNSWALLTWSSGMRKLWLTLALALWIESRKPEHANSRYQSESDLRPINSIASLVFGGAVSYGGHVWQVGKSIYHHNEDAQLEKQPCHFFELILFKWRSSSNRKKSNTPDLRKVSSLLIPSSAGMQAAEATFPTVDVHWCQWCLVLMLISVYMKYQVCLAALLTSHRL